MNLPPQIEQAPVIFLTGAGASVALGRDTTKQFWEHFRNEPLHDAGRRAGLTGMDNFIIWLYASFARSDADMEQVLSQLERNVDSLAVLTGQTHVVENALSGSTTNANAVRALNVAIRDAIYDRVIEHYSSVDGALASALYRPLLADYKLWMRDVPGITTVLPIFSLNYDLGVELAASELGLRCIDGLTEHRGATERRWNSASFENCTPHADETTVVLVKLHGSVRWGFQEDRSATNKKVIVELPRGLGRNLGSTSHAVLYPTQLAKPLDLEPFRTGYRILDRCLDHVGLAVVIGCSLRDLELRKVLADAMDDNPRLHLLLFGPDADHEKSSTDLGIDPKRVAAVMAPFDVQDPYVRGQGGWMPCIRGYAMSACSDDPVAKLSFKFGRTVEWLTPPPPQLPPHPLPLVRT
jgi:hypothetical protein